MGKNTTRSRYEPLSDGELMHALAAGDMEALGELYLRHGKMVHDALRRSAPELSVAETEDLAQEVFLVLNRTVNRYQERARFKAWLYTIAVRMAAGWRRTHWARRHILNRLRGRPIAIAPGRNSVHDRDLELRDTLTQAIATLPEDQRDVLFLHAVEGFTGEEIARILRIKPATVWTRFFRARRKILAFIEKEAGEPKLCKGEA